ncbi:hypothetical protein [Microbulbifer guangxiensis]|uniref:hypothetical protein n=1 Tax=Microbulbifer guangxiensis TaxID=2904249 RepID=UPI001F21EEE8|nr:hypothetical protein [Microbulbifer guangxiensis]
MDQIKISVVASSISLVLAIAVAIALFTGNVIGQPEGEITNLKAQLAESQQSVGLLNERIEELEMRLQGIELAVQGKEPRQEWKVRPLAANTD